MREPVGKRQGRDSEDLAGMKRKHQEFAEVMNESEEDSDYDDANDNMVSSKRQKRAVEEEEKQEKAVSNKNPSAHNDG